MTKVGSFAAVATFALALGGLAAALLVPTGGQIPGNIITAGHLQVQINHGNGSDLSVDNLAPGETRTAYQLITGNMDGIVSADLGMTLSATADTPFTRSASISISVSDPVPDGSGGSHCSPSTAFHEAPFPTAAMSSLIQPLTFSLGTLTNTNDALCVRFTIGLNQSAGNPVQGTSGSLSMLYNLTQNAVTP